jgi:molybdate-binding protein
VAAYIASGMADAGLGVEAGARRANLDFIPLASERYYLACHNEALATEPIETVIDVLRSADFRAAVGNLQGLDTESSGSIVSMKDAFGDPKP